MVSSDFTNNGALFCVLLCFFYSIMFMTFCVVIMLCHCLKYIKVTMSQGHFARGNFFVVNVHVSVIKHVLTIWMMMVELIQL